MFKQIGNFLVIATGTKTANILSLYSINRLLIIANRRETSVVKFYINGEKHALVCKKVDHDSIEMLLTIIANVGSEGYEEPEEIKINYKN